MSERYEVNLRSIDWVVVGSYDRGCSATRETAPEPEGVEIEQVFFKGEEKGFQNVRSCLSGGFLNELAGEIVRGLHEKDVDEESNDDDV